MMASNRTADVKSITCANHMLRLTSAAMLPRCNVRYNVNIGYDDNKEAKKF